MSNRASMAAVAAVLLLGSATVLAQAQRAYPYKPIRLIVGFPPGGNSDAAARLMAQRMSEPLGANIVVENRGGAGGSIAGQIAARAPADGYTLLWSNPGAMIIAPILDKKLPYDPVTSFTPVGRTFTFCNVLIVRQDSPLANLAQFMALAKDKPGHLQFGSQGMGSAGHLSGQMFEHLSGLRLSHVPFKGATDILTTVIGGDLAAGFVSPTAAVSQRARLRALAVTSAQRDPSLPEVPTMQEGGVKNYDVTFWFGVVVPAGTPPPIIARLNKELRDALGDAEVSRNTRSQGLNPAPSSPQEFAAVMRAESERWRKVFAQLPRPSRVVRTTRNTAPGRTV
ncbi:MAG: tripartite tricarboxylate transporter substrate binding protein [Betaproteobacteria bacterium]|nr:tripartite tricarboxylate transporter substrate binding protein [Betaproteobacteria bacterium]